MKCSFDVNRLAAGDQQEWDEMVQNFTPVLRPIVERNGVRGEEVDDLLQELWMELWNRRERLTRVEFLEAYLRKAAKYKVCSHFKFSKKELLILDNEVLEVVAVRFSRDGTWKIIFEDFLKIVVTFSGNFTTRQREAFGMVVDDPEISAAEMARRMKCTRTNVFKHMKTIRNRINFTFNYEEIKHELRNC